MLLIFTAFSVSIDAFALAIALSIANKIDFWHFFSVIVFTFFMSLIGLILSTILSEYIFYFSLLGSILLVVLGIRNLIATKREMRIKNIHPCIVGISVGVDAMIASFTICVPFIYTFAVAIIMSVFHGVFFILGQYFARFIKSGKSMSFASGIFLILLGIYRLF